MEGGPTHDPLPYLLATSYILILVPTHPLWLAFQSRVRFSHLSSFLTLRQVLQSNLFFVAGVPVCGICWRWPGRLPGRQRRTSHALRRAVFQVSQYYKKCNITMSVCWSVGRSLGWSIFPNRAGSYTSMLLSKHFLMSKKEQCEPVQYRRVTTI